MDCKMQTGTWWVLAIVVGRCWSDAATRRMASRRSEWSVWKSGSSSYAWDALYTGRQYDSETGYYHNRMRPLGSDLGRFLGRDPIGYEGAA